LDFSSTLRGMRITVRSSLVQAQLHRYGEHQTKIVMAGLDPATQGNGIKRRTSQLNR
jgi:hypothetical protein